MQTCLCFHAKVEPECKIKHFEDNAHAALHLMLRDDNETYCWLLEHKGASAIFKSDHLPPAPQPLLKQTVLKFVHVYTEKRQKTLVEAISSNLKKNKTILIY